MAAHEFPPGCPCGRDLTDPCRWCATMGPLFEGEAAYNAGDLPEAETADVVRLEPREEK